MKINQEILEKQVRNTWETMYLGNNVTNQEISEKREEISKKYEITGKF